MFFHGSGSGCSYSLDLVVGQVNHHDLNMGPVGLTGSKVRFNGQNSCMVGSMSHSSPA